MKPRVFTLLAVAALVAEAWATWQRSRRIGGNLTVRCRRGHLFSTIWVPGASLKSLRLGWWRVQRCPAARHWSLVTPVVDSRLPARQRRAARALRDIRIP